MTLLWGLITTAFGWLAEAPAWVWLCVAMFGVGFGLGKWGLPYGAEKPVTVTMSPAEKVDPTELRASVFASLLRHEMPDSTVTRQTTLPAWVFEDYGGNELTNVTYDADLPVDATLPRVPYMTVPMIANERPAVDVGSDRVQLTLAHPETGRPYTYRYAVPQDHWAITTEGTIMGAFNLDERALERVSSTLTGGVEYRTRRWTTRVAGGVQTSITDTDLGMYGVGEVSVRYTAKSW